MKNLSDGMKILIIVGIGILVIAAVIAGLYFAYAGNVRYATVDTSFEKTEPLDLTAELSVTPAPTATPAPTPEPTPEPEEPQPDEAGFYVVETTATVTGSSVNVRAEPNTDCEILGSLSRGQSLACTGYSEGWLRVEYNGDVAYVSAEYAQMDEE